MKRSFAALAALLALASCARAAEPTETTPTAPTVIVLSLDGVRHDYLDRAPFPAFARVAREGLRANRLVPVYPSSTFPGHVSLATGATPAVHGIVDNQFWDRALRERFDYGNDARWIEAEPLWAAAERQGVPAATFFWVGSETDWRGVGARYRVAPFDAKVGEEKKVAQILAWLDLPASERPRLVMSWWHGADHAGHAKGPDDPDVAVELAAQDRQLGALLAGLDARGAWSHTTLLVVSDHGMTRAGPSVPLAHALRGARVRVAHLEMGTAVAHVFLADPGDAERAERALAGLAGVRVDRREALPASLHLSHPTRTGDLVVRAEPPYTFASEGLLARAGKLLGASRGVHGYAPEDPDMQGIFLAIGRGVPAGAHPDTVRMIDVAPTVARLLGIGPPRQAEGRPIEAFAE
ncbi:MAG TPA: alkaline phosphatase family protein [Myxococcota bacterium]|nr:alkaline phosphatase family protein [Myxococcota bacterium]